MAARKTKRSHRFKWPVCIIMLVVLGVFGFRIYDHFSIAANKRSFQDARTTIDSIYYDAVKQIGPADNAEIGSSCSKTYQEFTGYGDLTCYLNANFIYGVSSESEANSIFKKVQDLVKNNFRSFRPTKTLSASIEDRLVVNSVYHAASDGYSAFGLRCTINYIYDTPREIDLSIKDSSKNPFEITIGCSGPAKQQYYRLASQ
jgi:hypothetical protein